MTTINLPQSKDIEQYMIGAILNSINAANEFIPHLSRDDFFTPEHQIIFEALNDIYKENSAIDLAYTVSFLKLHNLLEKVGGESYIFGLYSTYQSIVDYQSYFKDLKNISANRQIMQLGKDMIYESAKSKANSKNILTDIVKRTSIIQGFSSNETKATIDLYENFSEHGSFDEHIFDMHNRVKQGHPPYIGIKTNYPLFDSTLGFLKNSCIYYIGARPSMGKTTFMLNLINSIMLGGNQVPMGIFSLEMPAEMLFAKLICIGAGIKYSDYEDMLINDEMRERLIARAKYLTQCPLYFEDEESITISKLCARARRLKLNFGIKILFIDYLTRIKSDTKYANKHLQVDEVSKGLQSLAKELKIPVICLAQLNRESAKNGQAPTLSAFKESGSIEEDADAAILLHRPDYYDKTSKPGTLEIHILKNRVRGITRILSFNKDHKSELYNELQDIKEVIKQCSYEASPLQDFYNKDF